MTRLSRVIFGMSSHVSLTFLIEGVGFSIIHELAIWSFLLKSPLRLYFVEHEHNTRCLVKEWVWEESGYLVSTALLSL